MNLRSLAALAGAAFALAALPGCQVTIVDGGGDGGGCGEGSNCLPEECPAAPPSEFDSCDTDGLLCSYTDAEGCTTDFRCDPVYPEAGAPSEFVVLGSEGCTNCLADPTCEPYEIEASSCEGVDPAQFDCHSVSACGTTIYCLLPVCDQAPQCDPGDVQVDECLQDVGCYTVSSCDSAILCSDIALPQAGCPALEPESGDPCGVPGEFCDYPDGPDCFMSYYCQEDGTIMWSGGGCEGSG